MNMASIDELLTLRKVRIIEGSDFYSSYGADLSAARRFLDYGIPDEGISAQRILESAHPTLSRLEEYELGLGLKTLVPVSIEGVRLTSMEKVVVREAMGVNLPPNSSRWSRFLFKWRSRSKPILMSGCHIVGYHIAPEIPTKATTEALRWGVETDHSFNPVKAELIYFGKYCNSMSLRPSYNATIWYDVSIQGTLEMVAEMEIDVHNGHSCDYNACAVEYSVKLKEDNLPPKVQEFGLGFRGYSTKSDINIKISFDESGKKYELGVFRQGKEIISDGKGDKLDAQVIIKGILGLKNKYSDDYDELEEFLRRSESLRFDPEFQVPKRLRRFLNKDSGHSSGYIGGAGHYSAGSFGSYDDEAEFDKRVAQEKIMGYMY